MGRIDIYRVDCVNAPAQKGPIDFRRCVNGNTIEGRDRGSCGPVEDLGHAYCGLALQAPGLHDTKQSPGKRVEKAPFHGLEVPIGFGSEDCGKHSEDVFGNFPAFVKLITSYCENWDDKSIF